MWIEICKIDVTSCPRDVTPFAGVWIEILSVLKLYNIFNVTPFAGVWIEITFVYLLFPSTMSLPSRECGLK